LATFALLGAVAITLLGRAFEDEAVEVFSVQLPSLPEPLPPQPAVKARPTLHAREIKLDLNRADIKELAGLPGITARDAARIAAARPFYSKRDLLKRHILTSEQYERVKDRVIAHRAG
jgi:DNA uptake protein ComE-like DNA-binding protein